MTETKAQPIQKNDSTQIRVEASTFKDRDLLQVREWYLPPGAEPKDENYRPTKRGVTLPLQLTAELAEAIGRVYDESGAANLMQ